MSSLDGSLGYKINENTSITLTGTNLLNFKYTDYWNDKACIHAIPVNMIVRWACS
jgi:outer membrane receptor protein involved in Fe transport